MAAGVGAYTRVRKQFKVPIAEFGGIQEAMAKAGREAYIILGATELTNAVIDNHEAPMVLSSIMKQSCTERGRRVLESGMDVRARCPTRARNRTRALTLALALTLTLALTQALALA